MKEKTYTLGRESGCFVAVADDSVSRLHAELTLTQAGHLFVTDCDSRNGTFVLQADGTKRPFRQEVLHPGDAVMFGECKFMVSDLIDVIKGAKRTIPPTEKGEYHKDKKSNVSWIRCTCGTVRPSGSPCPSCGTFSRIG